MKRLANKGLIAALVLVSMCPLSSLAQGRNLVVEANKLRNQANDQIQAGNTNAALQSLSDCADMMQQKEFPEANKAAMAGMVALSLGRLQRDTFKKRDWPATERVLRKKVSVLESAKMADTNDYQGTLRMLEIVLKTQGKSTETQTLKTKMKPLSGDTDKPAAKLEPAKDPPPPQD